MVRSYINSLNGKRYTFATYPGDNTHLTITRDEQTKTAKIVDKSGVTYDLKKTQIGANGGAEALWKFIDDALYNGFMECLAYKVMDYIIDEIKPARA